MKGCLKVYIAMLSLINMMNAKEPIDPLPLQIEYDVLKAELGKKLFSDPILSKDGALSCESCHNLQNYGIDGMKTSVGIDGKAGVLNSPSVYNARYNFKQFWDGRASTLEAQAAQPIFNPVEMGNDLPTLLQTVKNSAYNDSFKALYEDGVTLDNISEVLAEFEKTLVTQDAPFDRYLRGDIYAIGDAAKKGYALFKAKGCVICHHGVAVGANHYNKFGIMKHLPSDSLGLYDITKKEEDKYYFKVPSLRNVTKTAPYFHDGRTESLHEAVKIMSLYQLARPINDEEIGYILAFLESLTGKIPESIGR